VRKAVGEEGDKRNQEARNSAIEAELVKLVECEVPETLIEQNAKEKFAEMMADQRNSGMTDEELKKLITKEGFEKYKKVATVNIIKKFSASMAIDDLARREGLGADPTMVEDQLQLMKAQADQAGEGDQFDEQRTKASLEATLKRDAVMDWLASKIEIAFKDAPKGP